MKANRILPVVVPVGLLSAFWYRNHFDMTDSVDRAVIAGTCLFGFLGIYAFQSMKKGNGPQIPFTLLNVFDADTLEVDIHGKTDRLRPWGIDSPVYNHRFPEKSQPFGEKSKQYMESLLSGKNLTFIDMQEPGLARIYANGKDVQQMMLEAGLAWTDPRFSTKTFFNQCLHAKYTDIMARAQTRGVGLFADVNSIHPSLFRLNSKERQPVNIEDAMTKAVQKAQNKQPVWKV